MKKITSLFLAIVLSFSLSACNDNKKGETKMENNQLTAPTSGDTIAIINTTLGTFKIKFLKTAAPKAVENFIGLSQKGYYNDVTFHRVINDFMIQGGDPTGTGAGGQSLWGNDFEDEFSDSARHYRGAVSMANAGKNTNSSQFFIVTAKNSDMDRTLETLKLQGYNFTEEQINTYKELGGTPHLDNRHSVFGHVYEGMDIVDQIQLVNTDANDKPVEDIKITSINIEEIR